MQWKGGGGGGGGAGGEGCSAVNNICSLLEFFKKE